MAGSGPARTSASVSRDSPSWTTPSPARRRPAGVAGEHASAVGRLVEERADHRHEDVLSATVVLPEVEDEGRSGLVGLDHLVEPALLRGIEFVEANDDGAAREFANAVIGSCRE